GVTVVPIVIGIICRHQRRPRNVPDCAAVLPVDHPDADSVPWMRGLSCTCARWTRPAVAKRPAVVRRGESCLNRSQETQMNRTILVVGVLGALLGGCDNRPAAPVVVQPQTSTPPPTVVLAPSDDAK